MHLSDIVLICCRAFHRFSCESFLLLALTIKREGAVSLHLVMQRQHSANLDCLWLRLCWFPQCSGVFCGAPLVFALGFGFFLGDCWDHCQRLMNHLVLSTSNRLPCVRMCGSFCILRRTSLTVSWVFLCLCLCLCPYEHPCPCPLPLLWSGRPHVHLYRGRASGSFSWLVNLQINSGHLLCACRTCQTLLSEVPGSQPWVRWWGTIPPGRNCCRWLRYQATNIFCSLEVLHYQCLTSKELV